jgi:hypothetical protein
VNTDVTDHPHIYYACQILEEKMGLQWDSTVIAFIELKINTNTNCLAD